MIWDSIGDIVNVGYLIAAVCFIVALKMMNSPTTARKGNWVAMGGMAVALIATLFHPDIIRPFMPTDASGDIAGSKAETWRNYILIAVVMAIGGIGGVLSGRRIQMTAIIWGSGRRRGTVNRKS